MIRIIGLVEALAEAAEKVGEAANLPEMSDKVPSMDELKRRLNEIFQNPDGEGKMAEGQMRDTVESRPKEIVLDDGTVVKLPEPPDPVVHNKETGDKGKTGQSDQAKAKEPEGAGDADPASEKSHTAETEEDPQDTSQSEVDAPEAQDDPASTQTDVEGAPDAESPSKAETPSEGEDTSKTENGQSDGADDPSAGKETGEGEASEERELSDEEINEKQRAAIKEALERIARGEELTNEEKGNLCEMMMDQYYISKGYKPIHSPRVTSLDDKGHKGIDGVYEKDGKYVIADAKYGSSKLGETDTGTQMSETWINNRLEAAVGEEKAAEIRAAQRKDPSNVSTEVYHYDPKSDTEGNTHSDVYQVNKNGEQVGEPTVVETYHGSERVETAEGESPREIHEEQTHNQTSETQPPTETTGGEIHA